MCPEERICRSCWGPPLLQSPCVHTNTHTRMHRLCLCMWIEKANAKSACFNVPALSEFGMQVARAGIVPSPSVS